LIDVLPPGERAGGAPANVAFHLANSRAVAVSLCSRVGRDEYGHDLLRQLSDAGIDTGHVQWDEVHPTGVVHVRSDARRPVYDIAGPAAWDFIGATAQVSGIASQAAVVVYGTLSQRHPVSRSAIRALVTMARAAGALAVADLNLREPFFDEDVVLWTLRNCDLLKLNVEELQLVSGLLGARGEVGVLFHGLVCEFGLHRAVLTCGEEGSYIFDHGRTWQQLAVPTEPCGDTVGAGDAITAVLSAALALGVPLHEAAPLGAEVASFVVSQTGAMPRWPDDLVDRARQVLRPVA
jgi:fructokinase